MTHTEPANPDRPRPRRRGGDLTGDGVPLNEVFVMMAMLDPSWATTIRNDLNRDAPQLRRKPTPRKSRRANSPRGGWGRAK